MPCFTSPSTGCTVLLQEADLGPKTAFKIVDVIRGKLKQGKLKTGEQIRAELKQCILEVLQTRGGSTDLRLGNEQPGVILVVGVNGGGKTTTIGKLGHKFHSEGAKVSILQFAAYIECVYLPWVGGTCCAIQAHSALKNQHAAYVSSRAARCTMLIFIDLI